MEKTSSGLDQNVAGALTYALGWVTGAAFLLTEPSNKFVRFHALQSTIVFGGLSLLWFVALSIPFLGWLIALVILPPLSVVLWLLVIFKAYQGERFKLPFAGEIADQREH
ncbi:MAG TPA: hypothetical protein VJ813_03415 [Vicinamibacterales bacterium]|nr:hypothetical protein [Vicinamibacterales bacterium]